MALYLTKAPAATLDYTNDWAGYLATDTITTSLWTVPNGITIVTSSNTATTATVWVSGGTSGTLYTLTNTISTAGGRTDTRTIYVSVISAALGEQVARLRRMINEPTDATYSDGVLIEQLRRYALIDQNGIPPQYLSTYSPPVYADNTDWIATYDLNAVAADIWSEKAGAISNRYDFRDDRGQQFSRSQAFDHAMQQARYYRSRRAASSVRLASDNRRRVDSPVINEAEYG